MWNDSRLRQAGYSLTELMIVVTILAIGAAIVVPAATSPDSERQLQLVAEEFAAAIRFARSESIRTGEPHGFRFLTTQYRIRVYTTDTSGSPWTWIWDVHHPISKQLYDFTFPAELEGATTPVVHTPVFRGTCTRPGTIYFDAHGTPRCIEPETVLLESYGLTITSATGQANVDLDGLTGRVTVQ